jgi:hypothetical protein
MDIDNEDDDLLRDADEDEEIDTEDPGLESDEEVDGDVDADGGSALHKRTD